MSLRDELLAVSTAPTRPARRPNPDDFTRAIEVTDTTVEATVRARLGETTEDTIRQFLISKGLNPDMWEVVSFRSSEWTMANGEPGESIRYSFRRIDGSESGGVDIAELVSAVKRRRPTKQLPGGPAGYVVALGDLQLGKGCGDGVEGTLRRTLDYLDAAAQQLAWYRKRYDIGHVHVAWLGDHIEGFVSQGGANAWRTTLTLSEQLRLTRRVMLYAVERFAPLAAQVTMVACPGNHGDTVRFNGKSQGTRYDDSHDTECLIAVSEACALNPAAFGHVEFYTPESDEMTVVLNVAGTVIGHVHGHQWRPGKHFDWWEGQSFGDSPLRHADLLLAGHLHHEHVEARGRRLFAQVPALESESTWYRHAKGVGGYPGILAAVVQDGGVHSIEMVRSAREVDDEEHLAGPNVCEREKTA